MVKRRDHFIDKIKIMKKEELWLRLKEMLSGTIGTQEYYRNRWLHGWYMMKVPIYQRN